MPTPYWSWCPSPGAQRSEKMSIDQTNYGDGYMHRATRGINPVRPSWSLQFPFRSPTELDEMYAFLRSHAVGGFWFLPPDSASDTFVVADEWSASIADKNKKSGIVGTLSVTFVKSFNPQPVNPT